MTKEVKVHPIKDGRRVPIKQLMQKLNVIQFNHPTPFKDNFPKPSKVKIYLKQHTGLTAGAIVSKDDRVSKGDLIGKIDEDKLGANIHSSISGKVEKVNSDFIEISS